MATFLSPKTVPQRAEPMLYECFVLSAVEQELLWKDLVQDKWPKIPLVKGTAAGSAEVSVFLGHSSPRPPGLPNLFSASWADFLSTCYKCH